MKKNLYFRQSLQREKLNTAVMNQIINFSSYPRLLLEVFIRKNMGERYFSIRGVYFILELLVLIPLIRPLLTRFHGFDWASFALHYGSWYVFLGAFYWFSRLREKEVKREPSVYDFKKFSLYSGDVDPRFLTLGKGNYRMIETTYEPGLFFAVSLVLIVLAQNLGFVLLGCSMLYALSYIYAYRLGDDFVMNMIDEMICNEELENVFVNDKEPEDARGVRFYGRKPADEKIRRKLVSRFTEEEESVPVL